MLCYRDFKFCQSDCTDTSCMRHPIHTKGNVHNLPVSWHDFSKYDCKDYIRQEKKRAKAARKLRR